MATTSSTSSVCQSLVSYSEPQQGSHGSTNPLILFEDEAYKRSIGTEQVYVHPTARRSHPSISLETCTEYLCNESGSDLILDFDDFCRRAHEKHTLGENRPVKKQGKNVKKVCDYPPPLTSIGGHGSRVQVHAQREGGRLMVKASKSSSPRHFFRAERENGRLRLSLHTERCEDESVEREKIGRTGLRDEEENEAKGGEKHNLDGEGDVTHQEEDCGKINGGDWSGCRCSGKEMGDRSRFRFRMAIS